MKNFSIKIPKGLNKKIVEQISQEKSEPGWMTDFRLKALQIFEQMPLPSWGPDLTGLNIQDIFYYIKPLIDQKKTWDDVPENIKKTFIKLGIPQAEQKYLAGVGAQFESEVIYKSLKEQWKKKGVIFSDTSDGLKLYPEIFKKYFSTVVPAHDNKFAALNSAVWSGGSFVYVPKDVNIDQPLQAYFRINAKNMGQFERTLIIAEEGSKVHYIEGCSAPKYQSNSLHSAVVEIIAHKNTKVTYTTIQNWANNVYNLVTKRAIAKESACVEWIDGNFGSCITMKYPCVILEEPKSHAKILSIAVAGKGQQQDSGAKVIHLAADTTSNIIAKSVSKNGGRTSFRGLLKIVPNAKKIKSRTQCDALMLDSNSQSDTYPTIITSNSDVNLAHEASISKVNDDQMFYMLCRGLKQPAATAMLINSFIEPFVSTLPMEYAVELNRLIELEMEGSIG
ncbi:Fe-S cluster assembly protein SufB [Candidatus Dependentiae bacterium]|nr:Fe-S cluster assembly protein SufB [Candidatus Dependentiae bacterium]